MELFHICLHVLSNVLAVFCVANMRTPFIRTNSTRLPHLETLQMASRVMCCAYCEQTLDCNSVNYDMLTMECQISMFSLNEVKLHGITDEVWDNYAKAPMCKYSNWMNKARNVTNVAVGKPVTLSSTYTVIWYSFAQRLHDLDIWVGNTNATLELAAHLPGIIGADCVLALPPPTFGCYVKLQIITPGEYFTICELEVYV